MSYCRFDDDSDKDFYFFSEEEGVEEVYVCYKCRLQKNRPNVKMHSPKDALQHLEDHKKQTHPTKRHKVPEIALRRLRKEAYGSSACIHFWACGRFDQIRYENNQEVPYDKVFEIAEEISNIGLNVAIVNCIGEIEEARRIILVDDRVFSQR